MNPSTAPNESPLPSASSRRLSIIIPAHNEAATITSAITSIAQYAGHRRQPVQVIVIDDGSRDDTAAQAQRTSSDFLQLTVVRNDRRRGKGYSVRRGMLGATGDLRLFCDADMSTPIEQLDLLIPWVDRGFDVVIASRKHCDSVVQPPQPLLRRAAGAMFARLRRALLLRDIADTQCGFKLFTRAAATAIFTQQTVTSPAFDCEILALARAMNYRIKEVGVLWRNNPQSHFHPLRDGPVMVIDLLRIRSHVGRVVGGKNRG